MSNQLQNHHQFVLNTNSRSITLHKDAMNLLAPPIANPCNLVPQVSPDVQTNVSILNFNLNGQESNAFDPEMQTQNMSQTAQIVFLPTQNLNLANVPKQEQLQMILPNDGGYQLIPNVGVIVPTTILFADKNQCILIPQNSPSQSLCPSVQPLPTSSELAHINEINSSSPYPKQWLESNGLSQFQMVSTASGIEFEDGSPTTLNQLVPEADCDFIALANTGTQTVISGIAEGEVPQQQGQLLSNNCQIVGIIPSNQLGILQAEPNIDGQVVIAACIEPGGDQEVNEDTSGLSPSTDNYDINSFLASTIASASMDKSDQNQAKEWLRDSCIVNRALRALSDNENRSSSRNSQVLL